MPVAVSCPRCGQEIQVPAQLAGRKAVCPRCSRSFWVPAVGPAEKADLPTAKESVESPLSGAKEVGGSQAPVGTGGAQPLAEAPPAVPERPRAKEIAASVTTAHPPQPGVATPRQPPLGYVPPKRVARLVMEDSIPSALVLAPDGQLPSLRLVEKEAGDAPQEKGRGVHPLLLVILLCTSVVVSLALLFVDFEGVESSGGPAKIRARWVIEQEYFSDLDDPGPRSEYQLLLREAQRAYARGDFRRERELYRQVLSMLRQERPKGESLTGSLQRDRRLEELLLILLSD